MVEAKPAKDRFFGGGELRTKKSDRRAAFGSGGPAEQLAARGIQYIHEQLNPHNNIPKCFPIREFLNFPNMGRRF